MIDDTGIFRTTVTVENPARPGVTTDVSNVMVDTGSEYTWLPRPVLEALGLVPIRVVRFVTADGRQIEREVCFGNIYAGGSSAPDILVFASAPLDGFALDSRDSRPKNLGLKRA